MKTIVVTGGAGYIGSHTIIELLERTAYNVLSIDNFSRSTADTYSRIRKIVKRGFETADLDLCNKQALEALLGGRNDIEAIIHFAAFKSVPESMSNPLLYYNNNITSLTNLLECCGKFNIRNFIFSSSCSVYGNADRLPVTEDTPLKKAESPYGHTRQIGEEIISFYCGSNRNVRSILLRYFNPVGAHMSGLTGEMPLARPDNLVPIITQTAAGKNSLTVFGNDYDTRDGSCIRDYIHVSDIAHAHVKAVQLLEKGQNEPTAIFNLGSGNGVSVLEVIASFEKVSGLKLPYKIGNRRPGDVIAVYSDNKRSREILGWTPEYSLDDMMLSAWRWQQNLEKSHHLGSTK